MFCDLLASLFSMMEDLIVYMSAVEIYEVTKFQLSSLLLNRRFRHVQNPSPQVAPSKHPLFVTFGRKYSSIYLCRHLHAAQPRYGADDKFSAS